MHLRAAAFASLMILFSAGCASTHARNVQSGLEGDRLTLGNVQREIHKGMSNADVVESLGSPNIVTTDEEGRENWVYDKFATDVVSSSSGWSIFGAGAGVTGGALIGVGGTGGANAGASSTSQRTLTIIVKFDENHRVRDFAYRSSRF